MNIDFYSRKKETTPVVSSLRRGEAVLSTLAISCVQFPLFFLTRASVLDDGQKHMDGEPTKPVSWVRAL